MALATDFQDGGRTLFLSGSGVLTGHELIDATEALLVQPERVGRITRAMVLLANVTVLDITPDQIRRLVGLDQQLARMAPRVAVAIVAPKEYMYGLARAWEALVDSTGWQTAVFHSRLDAET
jgi:hypothetical protein